MFRQKLTINEKRDNVFIFKVCLQFPDSLLSDSAKIALYLEKCIGKKVYILGDTTSGSCCVDEIAANHIKADAIVHFGHACLNPTARLAVFHVLQKRDLNIEELSQNFSRIFTDPTRNILVFYDVAYAHAIGKKKFSMCYNLYLKKKKFFSF